MGFPIANTADGAAPKVGVAFPICGDEDHIRPVADLTVDCHVNFEDFKIFVLHWLDCSDPNCE
jgi:hypothetical protein